MMERVQRTRRSIAALTIPRSARPGFLQDLVTFHPALLQWSQPPVADGDLPPSPRDMHGRA